MILGTICEDTLWNYKLNVRLNLEKHFFQLSGHRPFGTSCHSTLLTPHPPTRLRTDLSVIGNSNWTSIPTFKDTASQSVNLQVKVSKPGPSQVDDSRECDINLPTGLTWEELSRYDNDLPVSAGKSDTEICADVQATADSGRECQMMTRATCSHKTDVIEDIRPAAFSVKVHVKEGKVSHWSV